MTRQRTRLDALERQILQKACILIMAVFALPPLPGRPAFFTPLLILVVFGVAVLLVTAIVMTDKVCV